MTREKNPELHRQRVSESLLGNHRRWLGDNASYYAKHIWMVEHWGRAAHCDFCHKEGASRYEWANKNHGESRNKEDYMQLCPSCHRLYDQQNKCRKGHLYTPRTTYINPYGHRTCLICKGRVKETNVTLN